MNLFYLPQGVKASLRKGHKCKCDCNIPTKTKSNNKDKGKAKNKQKPKSEIGCEYEIVEYHFIPDFQSCYFNVGNNGVGGDQSTTTLGINFSLKRVI